MVTGVNIRCLVLEQSCSLNKSAVGSLTARVDSILTSVAPASSSTINAVIAEVAKQNRRRSSVIISGLPEAGPSSSSSSSALDRTAVMEILSTISGG